MHKTCIIEVINYIVKFKLRLNFEKKLKIKNLVTWSISEGRIDQKQIINFVQPNEPKLGINSKISHTNSDLYFFIVSILYIAL